MVLSSTDPADHRKPCTICSTPRDVLIRCQIDSTSTWHFVCPGSCWGAVSGGVVDGDAEHPYYRYGGTWKNKAADVSAKKPRKGKGGKGVGDVGDWSGEGVKYTKNDRVRRAGRVWVCRKSHKSREGEGDEPGVALGLWKEDDDCDSGSTGEG